MVDAEASATKQSISHFSAPSSMEGGSPATMPEMVLEYSEEENSRWRADDAVARRAAPEELAPLRRTMMSPSLRQAVFRTFQASARVPRMPGNGVGHIRFARG